MSEHIEQEQLPESQQFTDAVQDLCEAAADYIEAERPDSGQGSWGKAMMYNGVLVKLSAVIRIVNSGRL